MVQTSLLFLLLFMFSPYLKAQDQEAYGFEFQDNKVTKYLTEENGVAEVRIQVLVMCLDRTIHSLLYFVDN